ncbi:MAG TPA: hypothetical protein VK137_12460, partial [Planctomycetaceae bacterium]|nr:hypothetical protein [Planctomycetaceae bacterium]
LFADAPASDVVDQSSEEVPTMRRPSLLSLIEPRPPAPETFAEKCRRWRRSLPTWPIGAVLVIVLLAAWWYWPRQQRGINHRFMTIWTELQSRRTDFKDKAGFDRFVADAQTEVNDLVPWLEKHASAKDREKQLLLYIGRDCLKPMLKKPREVGSAQEKQLEMLFNALEDFYDPLRPVKLSPAPVGDKNAPTEVADPEKAASGGSLDPSALRPQPTANADKTPSK